MNSCGISLPFWRRRKVSSFLLLAIVLGACPTAFSQGAKVTALSEPIKEEDRDHPRQRDRWFMRGRNLPGESAAALRLKAQREKIRMRAKRSAMVKAQNAPISLSSASAGWIPLGPAPLASDASGGLGIQDYGPVSGRATSIAIDPADASGNTVFIGGAYGGVWKSINAGPLSTNPASVTWTPVTDDQASLAVGAIAIQPGNSNPASSVVLVGTGEANSSGDSYYGVGILRSVDGGNTWNLIQSGDGGAHPFLGLGFTKIAFSPPPNQNLVVAASAASSVGVENGAIANSIRGLYTSTDGGQTWSLRVPVDPNGQPIAPAASATAVVFNASMGLFYAAIRYHGFYFSSDGMSWSRLPNQPGGANLSTTACPSSLANPPACPIYRGEFAVVPGRKEMYVWYVDVNEKDQGIWQSLDGGNSWKQISDSGVANCGEGNGCGTEQGAYNLELAAVPSGSATDLYAGAINIFKCSLNSTNPTCSNNPFLNLTHVYGCSSIAKVHPDQHAVAFPFPLPSGKALMYFANDGGIYRALDGFTLTTGTCGGSNPFDSLNSTLGSMTQFVAFSQHPTDANTLLGGTQDNGSPATSQATTSPAWSNVNGGDGGYNAITPSSPLDWFVSNPDLPPQGLEIDHCSSGVGCRTVDFANGAVVKSVQLGNDDGDFYFPYMLDPQSDHELLVGTCRVWRGGPSTSSTGAYTALSNNFDTLSAATCTGNEVNLVRGLAARGSKSGGFSNVVYATTNGTGPGVSPAKGGAVWVTTNAAGGPSAFKNVTGSINPGHFNISSVSIDASDPTGNTAYITIMGFHVSHVFKTTNAGASWTDFSPNGTGLPDAPANAVVVDSQAAIVYVGTDVGVFSSSTASPAWTEAGSTAGPDTTGFLPNVPVTALKIFNSGGVRLLRASTYGRGVWQLPLVPYVISIANTPLQVLPNTTAIFNGSLTGFGGYSSQVALSCANGSPRLPATCTPTPTPVAPGAAFTVSASDSAVNDYTFNVHGVGADTNHVTQDVPVILQVVDFGLSALSSSSVTANTPNSSPPVSFTVTALGSFDQTVALSCTGLPAGAACSFTSGSSQPITSVSPTASSPVPVQVIITTTPSTPTGASTVTIKASALGGIRSQTLALTVTALADFTIGINNSPQSANVNDGSNANNMMATFNGSLAPYHAYNATVNLTCGPGAPPQCSVAPTNPSVSGADGTPIPFTVTVSSPTVQKYNFNVIGTGTDAATTTHPAALVFNSLFWFKFNVASTAQTVTAGQSATFSFTLQPVGGTFPNAVTFSCSVSPSPSLAPVCSPPPPLSVGSAQSNVSLTLSTTAAVASLHQSGTFYALWLPLPGIGFIFAGIISGKTRQKKRAMNAAIGSLLLLLLLLGGCGGGGSSTGGPPPPQPGTPAGAYQVTLTASSGTVSQQQVVTLTVQ